MKIFGGGAFFLKGHDVYIAACDAYNLHAVRPATPIHETLWVLMRYRLIRFCALIRVLMIVISAPADFRDGFSSCFMICVHRPVTWSLLMEW